MDGRLGCRGARLPGRRAWLALVMASTLGCEVELVSSHDGSAPGDAQALDASVPADAAMADLDAALPEPQPREPCAANSC